MTKDFSVLKHNLKGAFRSIKDELDQHIDSINQNTNEIQANYESFAALESKVEKLSEKIDEMQIQLNPHFYSKVFDDIQLSRREQEVFLGIYTQEDRVAIDRLAKTLKITPEMCDSIICSIRAKGIPIVRQLVDEVMHFSLDYAFKDLQARKNILKLEITTIA